MTRIAFKMYLLKGNEKEYKRRHEAIGSELKQLLKDAGINKYAIYLDEPTGILFSSMEVEDEKKLSELSIHPVMKKWWKFMRDLMQTNSDDSPITTSLEEVFYLP